jgi:geranylgeranyl diphosphate synthase type I
MATSKTPGGARVAGRSPTNTPPGNPFLALVNDVRGDLEARLCGFLDAAVDQASTYGADLVAMVSAIRDLCLRGGKRLRPALAIAGFRAAGNKRPLGPALDAGVALELLHAYLLIHDDWMDQDAIRRGGPTVHTLLAKRYRSQQTGDASGILAGDFAAALALEALSRVDIPAARFPKVVACFARMQQDVVFGQQLDLLGRARDVEAVYALKTSSYSVQGPLNLGALLAGSTPTLLRALDQYASPLGIAFQLRDDLLGAFGKVEHTGKSVGSDLRQGKRTALVALALRRLRGSERAELCRVLGNKKASDAQIGRTLDLLQKRGIPELVETRITELANSARVALDAARLPRSARDLLVGAVDALTERTV